MHASTRRLLFVLVALGGLASTSAAAPIPSRAAEAPVVDDGAAVPGAVGSFLARAEVARALAAQGLTADEAQRRLARLSEEDLATLAAHLEQVQAAGEVPKYIWVLLAILMGVTILATVF